jgi:hypothetical protein
VLDTEVPLVLDESATLGPIAVTFDAILRQRSNGTIWILDYKTTSEKPFDRVALTHREPQSRLYCLALRLWCLLHDVPPPAGIIFLAVRKPTIRLCGEDRPFREYDYELKSGPRKGQIERRRDYFGEPCADLYRERVVEWLTRTGRYAHLAISGDPPAVFQINPIDTVLDDAGQSLLAQEIVCVNQLRRAVLDHSDSNPQADFWPNVRDVSPDFRDFYLLPPPYWPSIISQKGFRIVNRDADMARRAAEREPALLNAFRSTTP